MKTYNNSTRGLGTGTGQWARTSFEGHARRDVQGRGDAEDADKIDEGAQARGKMVLRCRKALLQVRQARRQDQGGSVQYFILLRV